MANLISRVERLEEKQRAFAPVVRWRRATCKSQAEIDDATAAANTDGVNLIIRTFVCPQQGEMLDPAMFTADELRDIAAINAAEIDGGH